MSSTDGPHFHSEEDPTPNKSFLAWVKSEHSLYLVQISALITGVGLFASVAYYLLVISEHVTIPFINTIVIDAHLVFLILIIYKLIIILNNSQRKYHQNAKSAYKIIFNDDTEPGVLNTRLKLSEACVKKFKKYFLYFWISMFVLYAVFSFRNAAEIKENSKKYLVTVPADTLRSIYYILNGKDTSKDFCVFKAIIPKNTFEAKKINFRRGTAIFNQEKIIANNSWGAFIYLLPAFITFGMNCISSMFIFWCFTLLISPPQNKIAGKKQIKFVHKSIFCLLLLFFTFYVFLPAFGRSGDEYTESKLKSYITFFNAISGVLNCFVLALFIARLDSKLIGLKSFWVGLLYFYAAVQPLFVVFEESGVVNEVLESFVFIIVFLAKIYFFLIVLYALQEGRILHYMYSFPILDKRVNSVFRNQFEINIREKHIDGFCFDITKKGKILHRSDLIFKSKKKCYKDILILRCVSKNKFSYRIENFEGTFWAEIFKNEITYCRSIDFRSEADVQDMINESINMISHCQINNT